MIGPFKVTWLVLGLAAPLALGVLAAWLGSLFARKGPGDSAPPLVGGVVLTFGAAMASVVGMLALLELPPWRPLEGTHWLLMAVLPAGLVVAIVGLARHTGVSVFAWFLRIVVAAVVAPLLTRPLVPYTWTKQQAFIWWVGIGLFTCVAWWLTRRFGLHHGGRLAVFIVGGTFGVLAGVTMASGYLTGGQFAASPSLATAGVWLVMLIRGAERRQAAAVIDLIYPLLIGVLVYTWQFGWRMEHEAAPFVVAGLLAIAPLGVWAGVLPPVSRRSERFRTLSALLLCGLMLASAAGLAGYEAKLRAEADSAYEYDY